MPNDLKLIPNNFEENKKIFEREKDKLITLLSDFNIKVEHIGSTAIPNTIGKGIIDIIVICESESDQEKIKNVLIEGQYRQGELNKIPDGRLFFCNTNVQTQAGDIHLHLVIQNSNNLQSIYFRDFLLNNPDKVNEYNDEKIKVAKQANNDRHQYTLKKSGFISKYNSLQ